MITDDVIPSTEPTNQFMKLSKQLDTILANQRINFEKIRIELETTNKKMTRLEELISPKPLKKFKVFPMKDVDKMKQYIQETTNNADFVQYLVTINSHFYSHRRIYI